MLCSIDFVFFDDKGSEVHDVVEQSVDLDYWNIRQWRRLYYLLSKRQEKQLTFLYIRPHASFQLLPPKIG